MYLRVLVTSVLAMTLWPNVCVAQAGSPNWQAEIRQLVTAQKLPEALALAERRLVAAPDDLEARGWRARLLSWTGRLPEAEAEYRRALQAVPADVDLLLGLSDVLAWQKRYAESLEILDRAQGLNAPPMEIEPRRERARHALTVSVAELTPVEPAATQTRSPAAAAIRSEYKSEFRIGADFDFFNTAVDAQAFFADLRTRWNDKWTTVAGGVFQRRFGERPARFTGAVTYRITPNDAITVGGAAGRDGGVVAKGEMFFEYGRGIRFGSGGFVRGMEVTYRQQWLWFRDARILALTPGALFYLPRDWMWSIQVTAARSRFTATPAEWRPSGVTRLTFPEKRGVRPFVFFAVGTENFAQVDQVGRFSARTWGGGARWQMNPRHGVSGYALYQDRSQGRTQTSFGMSYGFRF